MSNFKCDKCGRTNIDCGKDGFKTPREIELEFKVKGLEETIKKSTELEDLKKECEKYEQALDEIEKKCCTVLNGNERILYAYQIRDIINKAKDGE